MVLVCRNANKFCPVGKKSVKIMIRKITVLWILTGFASVVHLTFLIVCMGMLF